MITALIVSEPCSWCGIFTVSSPLSVPHKTFSPLTAHAISDGCLLLLCSWSSSLVGIYKDLVDIFLTIPKDELIKCMPEEVKY